MSNLQVIISMVETETFKCLIETLRKVYHSTTDKATKEIILQSLTATLGPHNASLLIWEKDVKLTKELNLEGNKGGDTIEITQTPEMAAKDILHVKIGQSCVYTADHTMPVELLVTLLTNFFQHTPYEGETLQDHAASLLLYTDKDFTRERASQVQPGFPELVK